MIPASQGESTTAKAGAAGSVAKEQEDKWVKKFRAHLASDRGASQYTQRNYAQALAEFAKWLREERQQQPDWAALQRDDFRGYVRFLGRHNLGRAAIQLRFSALRTFYKFLIRNGVVAGSPIKNIVLPKPEKRLPKFLTAQQMVELLAAPLPEAVGSGAQKRRGTADERGGVSSGRGDFGNDLFVRFAHQRTMRAERGGRGHRRVDGAGARQGEKGKAGADWGTRVEGD